MRSFLIFEQKNIRKWKITGKAINCILSFDKIIQENVNRIQFDDN